MIGLGSNRLTVCRRGGMSVTQAGRGGMEWLAGGRRPSWASPYSAQATAALKAQFPTQWPTIRDYGFAHPEIVGYMNAYAPEDAKIAYSLVEGIGTRWIHTDGYAWVNSGYVANDNSTFKTRIKNIVHITTYGGWQGQTDNSPRFAIRSDASQILYLTKQNGMVKQTFDNGDHVYEMGLDIFKKDGVQGTIASDSGNNDGHKELSVLVAPRYYNLSNARSSMDMEYWEADNAIKLVPYISRTYGMGMIDLISGSFKQKQGTGELTELIESPS